MRKLLAAAAGAILRSLGVGRVQAQDQVRSVWLVESSRFVNLPFGAFVPDRARLPGSTSPMNNIDTVDPPTDVGVITCADELVPYDAGRRPQDDLEMTGSPHRVRLPERLELIGFSADRVTTIAIGHGHSDHAGQLGGFPNATLHVRKDEPRHIAWALDCPHPGIRAVDIDPGGCIRSPASGSHPAHARRDRRKAAAR